MDSYAIAEAIAPSWARRRSDIEDAVIQVRRWMVRQLHARPGDCVLELAAGVGDTGFEAAKTLGDEGLLICSDFAPGMLDAARERAEELEIENVDYRLIDAQRIELGPDCVDGILCRFGFMLMSEPVAALTDCRRVLRPGGRLVFAVWGPPEQNPYFTAAVGGLVMNGHLEPPDPDGPGPLSMASSERTVTMLKEAGFTNADTEEVPVSFSVPDIESYLDFVADTAGPIGLTVQELAGPDRESVEKFAAKALEPYQTGDGIEIPGVALCAVAA